MQYTMWTDIRRILPAWGILSIFLVWGADWEPGSLPFILYLKAGLHM
jgi:hypothetical protein